MNARVKIKDRIETINPLLRDTRLLATLPQVEGWQREFHRGEIHGLLKALEWVDADDVVAVELVSSVVESIIHRSHSETCPLCPSLSYLQESEQEYLSSLEKHEAESTQEPQSIYEIYDGTQGNDGA